MFGKHGMALSILASDVCAIRVVAGEKCGTTQAISQFINVEFPPRGRGADRQVTALLMEVTKPICRHGRPNKSGLEDKRARLSSWFQ